MPADLNGSASKGLALGAATFDAVDAAPGDAFLSAGLAIGAFFYQSEQYAAVSAGIGISARPAAVGGDLANGRYRR